MPKLPEDADMNRIWALPLNQRVPALILSIVESNHKDSRQIVKSFLAVIEAIAQMQGKSSRLEISDLLNDCADKIDATVLTRTTEGTI